MNIGLLALIATFICFYARAEPARERQCYSTAETRDKIVSLGLSEPFHLMRKAAARAQGEAIQAKLCSWSEDLVYEISLLRRDGRVIRVFFDAKTGQVVVSKSEDRN